MLAELHAFLTAEGVHPAARGWITSSLGFASYHPEPVNDRAAAAGGGGAAQSADASITDVGGQRGVKHLGGLEAE